MSREIKFRAWHNSGHMIPWDEVLQHSMHFIFGYGTVTLMQFIGLCDNHNQGKEIYKGDIVRITSCMDETAVGEVVWDERRAGWAVDVGDELLDFANIIHCEHLVEIIGNKWDNPELLQCDTPT